MAPKCTAGRVTTAPYVRMRYDVIVLSPRSVFTRHTHTSMSVTSVTCVLSCLVSCRVVSRRVVSCRVVSCRTLLYPTLPYRTVPWSQASALWEMTLPPPRLRLWRRMRFKP